jgi:triosephosphate isomerase
MRTPFVAGNWKMNLDRKAAEALAAAVRDGWTDPRVELALCPPFVYLPAVAAAIAGSPIAVGGQNLYEEPSGAFTGEISGPMLADVGARYVILGHSERRHTIGHHEDDWMINRKVHAARKAGLTPILCVGETLAQRQAGQTEAVLTFQLTAGISGYALNGPADLVIAYEPVWAIGTGQVASTDQAQSAHQHLRATLRTLAGPAAADQVRILYGGSVKPDNAAALFAQPDVDGGLIGGASLKAADFLAIARAALARVGSAG